MLSSLDMLTSTLSTFPYDIVRSEKFIGLLVASRNKVEDGYTIANVARLWTVLSQLKKHP